MTRRVPGAIVVIELSAESVLVAAGEDGVAVSTSVRMGTPNAVTVVILLLSRVLSVF